MLELEESSGDEGGPDQGKRSAHSNNNEVNGALIQSHIVG